MSNTKILELPVELVELVLVNLHPLQIVKCRQACRFLCQLIDSSIELQLRIELAQDGHILKYRDHDPATSLRKRILLHRRALETFKPRLTFRTTTPGFWVHRYDISDGMIGSLEDEAVNGEPSRITYHELSCPEGHTRWGQNWDFPDMQIVDLSFWGVQDIQILTEECEDGDFKRLHFRTMSTNAPHPLAAVAHYDLRGPDMPVEDKSYTLMHEDILMMIFKVDDTGADGKAFAMNWKTGDMVLTLRDASDAAFIGNDLVLLSVNCSDKGPDSTGRPIFEILSLTAKAVLYRCNLAFERPTDGIAFINNQNFAFNHNRYLSQPKEFIPDFDLNILAVVVDLGIPDQIEQNTVVVVVMVKKLLDICERSALHSTGEVIEWDNWGPSATRWLPNELSDAGDLCVFGSRMVVWEKKEQQKELVMLDFNPRNMGRDSPSDLDEAVSVIRGPSTSTYNTVPESEVTSTLPYRKMVSGRFPYYNVDLDGMNLVCREHGDDLQILSLSVEDEEPNEVALC